jgi:hypothetical protein
MKDKVTREEFLKMYPNPFKLVTYAIGMVRSLVASGRGPRVDVESKNPAYIVLKEIECGKDKFEDIPETTDEE